MRQISEAGVKKSTMRGLEGGKALRNRLPWLSNTKDAPHLSQL